MDITQLILDDHHEQRRRFALLEQVDRADTETLRAVWGRLAAFLELHAAAEEEIFYPELLRVGVSTGRAAGASAAVLAELAELIADGELEIPIAATFPLAEVRDAYRRLAQGHVQGKIVLLP